MEETLLGEDSQGDHLFDKNPSLLAALGLDENASESELRRAALEFANEVVEESNFANDYVTVVGATEHDADSQRNRPAPFTSRRSQAEVAMDGMLPIGNGTSYSTPKLAALYYALHQVRPDLTPDEAEQLVLLSANQIGREGRVGAGVADPETALTAALGDLPR